MKGLKKFKDEEIVFFFNIGLSNYRRYHGLDANTALKEIALERPKAFKAIFNSLDAWRVTELIEPIRDDLSSILIKNYKKEVK